MKKISSRMTFFHKKFFPVVWIGSLLLFIFIFTVLQHKVRIQLFPFLVMPLCMLAFGYFLMKKLVFDLMDEVFDCGDFLLVKNSGEEDRIFLTNIANVSYSFFTNPKRVTLSLRQPSKFGKEITFSPPTVYIPFSKSPVVEELIQRIDAKRGHP